MKCEDFDISGCYDSSGCCDNEDNLRHQEEMGVEINNAKEKQQLPACLIYSVTKQQMIKISAAREVYDLDGAWTSHSPL